MTKEEVIKKFQEGNQKVLPIVEQMTNLIMDAYQLGFSNCFELLTGQKFNDKE